MPMPRSRAAVGGTSSPKSPSCGRATDAIISDRRAALRPIKMRKVELKCFVNALGKDRPTALKRTFVIVLESDAEKKDWGDFLEKPERPQFIAFYNSQGRPIPRFLEHEGEVAVSNPRYDNRLIDICETLLDRAVDIRKEQPSDPPGIGEGPRPEFTQSPAAARVTIGVATKDLKTWCRDLAERLQGRHSVVQLEPDDFYNAEAETFVAEHLGPHSVF